MTTSMRGADKLNVVYLYCKAPDASSVSDQFFGDDSGEYVRNGPGRIVAAQKRLTKWDVPHVSLPRIKAQFREFFQYVITGLSEDDKKHLAAQAAQLAPLLSDAILQDPMPEKAITAVEDPAEALRARLRAVPTPDAAPEEMAIQAAVAAP